MKKYLSISNIKTQQVASLYSATVLQTLFGLAISIIVTRSLTPANYGNYSYLVNLTSFVLVILSTGHFVSMSMVLARRNDDEARRNLLGTGLIITFVVSLIFVGIIYVFSFFQDLLFQDKIGGTIRSLAFLLILFPFQTFLENVLMGLNNIHALSILRVLPKILYILMLGLLTKYSKITYFSAYTVLLLSSYLVYILIIYSLKPKFSNILEDFVYLESENKKYGYQVYLGSLAAVASSYLCALSISYFTNNTDLGFFNLALVVSTPLILLPGVVATTFFEKFASIQMIPERLIFMTAAMSLVSYGVFVLLIDKVIIFFYTTNYLRAVSLAYILGLGMIIHGMGDVFNRFLCAKGKGREVRNGAFVSGGVNVAAFLILVPLFSSLGASIARLMLGVSYFTAMYLYYRASISKT